MANVREISSAQLTPKATEERYYKIQLKGWLNFDPSTGELKNIFQAMEDGTGLLTALEVTEVANDLKDIKDPEVRERFENMNAVNRVVEKLRELPGPLKERLHRALKSESEVAT